MFTLAGLTDWLTSDIRNAIHINIIIETKHENNNGFPEMIIFNLK